MRCGDWRWMLALMATLVAMAAGAGSAAAQALRPMAVEGTVGWAGFVDDTTIEHGLFGGAVRAPLGAGRLSVGPEIVYARGPASDRDLFVLGSLWVDLVRERPQTRIVPYVVAGAGYMRHSDRFASRTFASGEGSFTAGGGVRAHVTDRVYVGGDVRLGWELHLRATAHLGVRFPVRRSASGGPGHFP
jgi:opacity protein-like surface antigen